MFVKSLLSTILLALFILPTNSFSEEYVAIDEEGGKKLLTELKFCKDSETSNQSSIFALTSSISELNFALQQCEEASDVQVDIDKICEDVTTTLKEEVVFFQNKNSKCQEDLSKVQKCTPWYKTWYLYSNLGWLLLLAL